MRVNIDELDFFIIQEIFNSDTTTWQIAKKYFSEPKNKSKMDLKRFRECNCLTVCSRLKKMEGWGVVHIEKNGDGKKVYNLIKEHIKLGKHKFPDGYSDSICLKADGKWFVFEL